MGIAVPMTTRSVPGATSRACVHNLPESSQEHGGAWGAVGAGTLIPAIFLLQLKKLRGARVGWPTATPLVGAGARAAPGHLNPSPYL